MTTSKSTPAWLEIDRNDFVDALKRLKTGRITKAFLHQELQIGYLQGEAVFCIQGAQIRKPAKGMWNGFVCLSYGVFAPYLKVKPESQLVRLNFENGRLGLGITRLQAKWIEVSPWISQMALEAHFVGPDDSNTGAAVKSTTTPPSDSQGQQEIWGGPHAPSHGLSMLVCQQCQQQVWGGKSAQLVCGKCGLKMRISE
jgi:hypothetical protein